MSNELMQMSFNFDYALVSEENRLEAYANAEAINTGAKQVADGMVELGQRLIRQQELLKQENDGKRGLFEEWIETGCILKNRTVYRFMALARKREQLKSYLPTSADNLPPSVIDELLSASDEVIEQVTANNNEPTVKEIREAKRAEREALEKARLAEEAEKQASEQARLAQQQLFAVQSEAQSKIDELTQQITSLQGEMQELTTPKVQVKEVRVVPPEIKEQVEKLQEKVRTLTAQRDNLSEQARKLGEENRQAFLRRNEVEQEQTFRMHWRKTTQDFQESASKLISQMLTQIHSDVFETEDWDRLAQAKEIARRFIVECDNLSRGTPEMVVDAL